MPKRGISGVECPECGSIHTQTIDTGYSDQGYRLRRRRCVDCLSASFTTVEIVVDASFGSLDTSRRTLQREYARKKYGYIGREQFAHWRPAHLLKIDVKVLPHEPRYPSTPSRERARDLSPLPSAQVTEDFDVPQRPRVGKGDRGAPRRRGVPE